MLRAVIARPWRPALATAMRFICAPSPITASGSSRRVQPWGLAGARVAQGQAQEGAQQQARGGGSEGRQGQGRPRGQQGQGESGGLGGWIHVASCGGSS